MVAPLQESYSETPQTTLRERPVMKRVRMVQRNEDAISRGSTDSWIGLSKYALDSLLRST